MVPAYFPEVSHLCCSCLALQPEGKVVANEHVRAELLPFELKGLWRELPKLSPNASSGADATRDVHHLCHFFYTCVSTEAFLLWVKVSHYS